MGRVMIANLSAAGDIRGRLTLGSKMCMGKNP